MTSGIDFRWFGHEPIVWPDLAAEMLSRPSIGRRFQYTDAWPLRELGALGTRDHLHDPGTWYGEGAESRGDVHNIELVHVTCTCGWRSPLQRVRGAEWFPSVTTMAPEYEDAAHELWREHIEGKSIDGVELLARAGTYRLKRLDRRNVHELSLARTARMLRESGHL